MNAETKIVSRGIFSVSGMDVGLLDRLHHFIALCVEDEIAFLNGTAIRLLGLRSPQDAVGRAFFSFAHPDYADLAEVGLNAFAEDGTVVSMKLLRSDGSVIDVDLWVSRFRDNAFLVEAHDITGHLRAAHALRVREQRLQGIINTVADGIITLDEKGVIQTFNPAAEATFGFRAAEIIGRDIRHLIFLPGGTPNHLDGADWLRHLGSADNIVGQRKDGRTIQLEASVRELFQDGLLSFTTIIRDVSARKEAEMRVFHMAHHDALTGLPNRHLFGDRLDEAFKRAQRNGSKIAAVFIDLDRFKPINDTFGHASGDEVLKQIAARLSHGVRASDTVARVGGDEFMILLEGLRDREEAEEVATKIQAALTRPMMIGQTEMSVGASVGTALYPDDAGDALALMNYADRAMYKQKHTR